MTEPYYQDSAVTLYHGDMREVLPMLDVCAHAVITDPPYGETSLEWDRWPDGWPALVTAYTNALWCYGSMRMFIDRAADFVGWQLSQDIVWRKPHAANRVADRFKRIHEQHFFCQICPGKVLSRDPCRWIRSSAYLSATAGHACRIQGSMTESRARWRERLWDPYRCGNSAVLRIQFNHPELTGNPRPADPIPRPTRRARPRPVAGSGSTS